MNKFVNETRPKLSKKGQIWLDGTLYSLQKSLDAKVMANPNIELDDKAFTDAAFATHATAYIENGICRLSIEDKMHIMLTVDAVDLLSERGRAQIAEVRDEQFRVWWNDPVFMYIQAQELNLKKNMILFDIEMKLGKEVWNAIGLRSTRSSDYTADEVFQLLYGEEIEYFKQTYGDQFVW